MKQIFGGTNWGNLGHPNGYTSYDYGAVSVLGMPLASYADPDIEYQRRSLH